MLVAVFVVTEVAAHHFYSTFPITLKGYTGDKTNSVSYSGQIARHVLHDSLKKLAGKGDGGSNAAEIEAQMMKYFKGSKEDLDIIAPKTKGDFKIKNLEKNLFTKNMPNPDILIRTGGENRLSDFVMFHLAYTELFFLEVKWPDFTKEHLISVLNKYERIERRFGKVGEVS